MSNQSRFGELMKHLEAACDEMRRQDAGWEHQRKQLRTAGDVQFAFRALPDFAAVAEAAPKIVPTGIRG
jgi:hypothetical protein